MTVKKPHNGGTWTEARKKSFIVSALRSAFTRWGPKQQCVKNARIRRGVYKCEGCGEEGPATLPPLEGNKRRRKNIVADHIDPIVCPHDGFIDFNTWISRGFVELSGFQALCWQCHTEVKTKQERIIATKTRKLRKEKPKEYQSWINMKQRCNNPKSTGYEYYGERGISVCPRWDNLQVFIDDMGDRPEGTALDRIDVDGDYEPSNCRWATYSQQGRNKTNTHYISWNKVCKPLVEWSEETGLKANTILYRLRRGWPTGEALGLIPRKTPSTSRIDDDTWSEIKALRLEGYSTIELGEIFSIDPSQISRKAKLTNEERQIAKERRAKEKKNAM